MGRVQVGEEAERRERERGRWLGRALRRIRIRQGLSQRDAAARGDISPQQLNRTEKTEMLPSLRALYRMMRALGANFADLEAERLRMIDEVDSLDRPLEDL